jgi:hypothetical protein
LPNREVETKEKLKLFKLARFGDKRNPKGKGSYRWNGNVVYLSGIVADYDGEQVTLDDAAAKLRAAGIESFIYTTPSHTAEAPRWRVLAPLSVDTDPALHGALLDKLNGVLGGVLATESWTLSQPMYVGKVRGTVYETRHVSGDFLDRVDGIAPIGKKGGKLAASRTSCGTDRDPTSSSTIEEEELRQIMARIAIDPDVDYPTWVKVGMAIHHGSNGEDWGLSVWDEWSSRGSKYVDEEDLISHWGTFTPGRGISVDWLRQHQRALVEDFGGPPDLDLLGEVALAEHERRIAQFHWVQLRDLVKRPPASWLIAGILPHEEINMLYGASGAGKSFVALDMSLAIARGVPWRDLAVKRGAVGWIAAEAEGSLRNRYIAYCKKHDLNVDTLDNFAVLGAGVNLSDTVSIQMLADSAARFAPALIVIDTLAAASAGANENSSDMAVILANCRLVYRVTGATVLLVHHSGKNEDLGARGWSGIRAAVHAELHVCKRDSDTREIAITKMRDGEEGPRFPFKLLPVTVGLDDEDRPIVSAVVEHASASAARKPADRAQGKWHRPIRDALGTEGRLPDGALYRAVLERVPEKERTTNPRRGYRQARDELLTLEEIRLGAGDCYELIESPIDNVGDPDEDLVGEVSS